ncbi:MAG: hotdog fold domain-containing protein [Woeseiaceae bacterium]|nr:hotdog fold domain-containing protein [Woeseiaceae bacterium]
MSNSTMQHWQRLSKRPAGKWLFSRIVCLTTPYFSSIGPRFVELERFRSVVTLRKRRKVHNHLGTVHAIAVCNLAEAAAGVMTHASMPSNYRWIPKRMSVEYLLKAETDLKAVAVIDPPPAFDGPEDVPVKVSVTDTADQVVFTAVITMYITPRKSEA